MPSVGIDLVVPDADFTRKAAMFDNPVPDRCEAFFALFGDLNLSAVNLADNRPSAQIVGEPVANADTVSMKSQSDYLQSGVIESTNMTFAFIAKSVDAGGGGSARPTYLGNFMNIRGFGPTIYPTSPTAMNMQCTVDNNGAFYVAQVSLSGDTTKHSLWIADITATTMRLFNMTDGTTASVSIAAYGRPLSVTNRMRIGSGHNNPTLFLGKSEMAFAAAWSKVLSSAERAAVYQSMKALFDGTSVVI